MAPISGETNCLFFPLILLPPLIFIIIFFKLISPKAPPLPPGPYGWPIVGNIFQLGKNPHVTLATLAQVHGPLILVRIGARPFIIGSSPEVAKQILKINDRELSGRPVSDPLRVKGSKLHNLALGFFDECDDRWKRVRTVYRSELFSAKALESQVKLREKHVMEMMKYLGSKEGQVVSIKAITFATALNILSNVMFSMDFIDFEGKGVGKGLRECIRRLAELGAAPQLVDMYPILRGWDFQSYFKKVMDIFERMCATWVDIVKARRKQPSDSSGPSDFTDALVKMGLSDEQIDAMLEELFSAGTESTSATTEWALTELIRNPEALQKLRSEITKEISGDTIRESDLPRLPYLQACLKETLRLHPPGPLLLPHRAVQTCEVMGYTIPKDSLVTVNMWAIGRDPAIWTDPLSFKPERFLMSGLDYMGNDYEYLPFGSGRRMCPGQPFATRVVPLIVASLIDHFDWFLPKNMDPAEIDMTDQLDVTMQKEVPLCVIPKLRRQLKA